MGIFLIVCRIRHNERLEFLGDAVLELISRWNTLDNYLPLVYFAHKYPSVHNPASSLVFVSKFLFICCCCFFSVSVLLQRSLVFHVAIQDWRRFGHVPHSLSTKQASGSARKGKSWACMACRADSLCKSLTMPQMSFFQGRHDFAAFLAYCQVVYVGVIV